MIRVVVIGSCGRTGSVIADLISRQPDMILAGGVEAFGHPSLGTPLGKGLIVANLEQLADNADVVVDFSSVLATMQNLPKAAAKARPYILGVTGFTQDQSAEIDGLSKSLPLVWAPNFSVGVNVLYRLTEQSARLLKQDYDFEIIEIHHRGKRDAPSGTAKHLAGILSDVTGRGKLVYGRVGAVGEKAKDEIGIHSVRSGDTVGEHHVIISTEGERLELVHKATSRLAFAQGVLRAIRFIIGKPNGTYGMNDVLGLKND